MPVGGGGTGPPLPPGGGGNGFFFAGTGAGGVGRLLGAGGRGTVYGGFGRTVPPMLLRCTSKLGDEGGGGGTMAVPVVGGRPLGPMYAPGGGAAPTPLFIPPDGPM